ncbi:hypothetical protein BpHYR1_037788 [Brachionus plicatilis]|uniref:Uncharacterized protein n=1 Tax=Brachionus plicatilis TaxID=10195 RepID=A0A3M7PAF1_BRAPC|nr:hypothetical protein BpHYR1_037788 [Brachionus plicatilis]
MKFNQKFYFAIKRTFKYFNKLMFKKLYQTFVRQIKNFHQQRLQTRIQIFGLKEVDKGFKRRNSGNRSLTFHGTEDVSVASIYKTRFAQSELKL